MSGLLTTSFFFGSWGFPLLADLCGSGLPLVHCVLLGSGRGWDHHSRLVIVDVELEERAETSLFVQGVGGDLCGFPPQAEDLLPVVAE